MTRNDLRMYAIWMIAILIVGAHGQMMRNGHMMPHNAQRMPSQHQMMPSQGQMRPSEAQMMLSQGQMRPSEAQMMSVQDQMVHRYGQMMPGHGQRMSGHSQVLPNYGQTMTGYNQVIPDRGQMTSRYVQMQHQACPLYASYFCACSAMDQPKLKQVKMCLYQSDACHPCPNHFQNFINCSMCPQNNCPICSPETFGLKEPYSRTSYVYNSPGMQQQLFFKFSTDRNGIFYLPPSLVYKLPPREMNPFLSNSSNEIGNMDDVQTNPISNLNDMKNEQNSDSQNIVLGEDVMTKTTMQPGNSSIRIFSTDLRSKRDISGRIPNKEFEKPYQDTRHDDYQSVVNGKNMAMASHNDYDSLDMENSSNYHNVKDIAIEDKIDNDSLPVKVLIIESEDTGDISTKNGNSTSNKNDRKKLKFNILGNRIQKTGDKTNQSNFLIFKDNNIGYNDNKAEIQGMHPVPTEGSLKIFYVNNLENSWPLIKYIVGNNATFGGQNSAHSIIYHLPNYRNRDSVLNLKTATDAEDMSSQTLYDGTKHNVSKVTIKSNATLKTSKKCLNFSDINRLLNENKEKCVVEKDLKDDYEPVFDFQCITFNADDKSLNNPRHKNKSTAYSNGSGGIFGKRELLPLVENISNCLLDDFRKPYIVIPENYTIVISNCEFAFLPNFIMKLVKNNVKTKDQSYVNTSNKRSEEFKLRQKLFGPLQLELQGKINYLMLQNDNKNLSDNYEKSIFIIGRLAMEIRVKLSFSNSTVDNMKSTRKETNENTEAFSNLSFLKDRTQDRKNSSLKKTYLDTFSNVQPSSDIKLAMLSSGQNTFNNKFLNISPNEFRSWRQIGAVENIDLPYPLVYQKRLGRRNNFYGSSNSLPLDVMMTDNLNRKLENNRNSFGIVSHRISMFPDERRKEVRISNYNFKPVHSSGLSKNYNFKYPLHTSFFRYQGPLANPFNPSLFNPFAYPLLPPFSPLQNQWYRVEKIKNDSRNVTIFQTFNTSLSNGVKNNPNLKIFAKLNNSSNEFLNNSTANFLSASVLNRNSSKASDHVTNDSKNIFAVIDDAVSNKNAEHSSMNKPANSKNARNDTLMTDTENTKVKSEEGENTFYNEASNAKLYYQYSIDGSPLRIVNYSHSPGEFELNFQESNFSLTEGINNKSDSPELGLYTFQDKVQESAIKYAKGEINEDEQSEGPHLFIEKLLKKREENDSENMIVHGAVFQKRKLLQAIDSDDSIITHFKISDLQSRFRRSLPENDWCEIKRMVRHGTLECTIWSYKKECGLVCHAGYSLNGEGEGSCQCSRKKNTWTPPMTPCVGDSKSNKGEKQPAVPPTKQSVKKTPPKTFSPPEYDEEEQEYEEAEEGAEEEDGEEGVEEEVGEEDYEEDTEMAGDQTEDYYEGDEMGGGKVGEQGEGEYDEGDYEGEGGLDQTGSELDYEDDTGEYEDGDEDLQSADEGKGHEQSYKNAPESQSDDKELEATKSDDPDDSFEELDSASEYYYEDGTAS